MNQSKSLIVLVLLSVSIFAPMESFAQSSQENSDFFSSLIDLIQQFFPSAEVEINTDSNSIEEFNEAAINVTLNTSTESEDDKSNYESTQNNNAPSFADATVEFSSDTSVENDKKVTLCHIPQGNTNKASTITVGNSSVATHLDHGDYLGECVDSSSINTETNVQEFENAIVEMSSNTSVDSKVTLCHVPTGNPNNAHTIRIGDSAVESHMTHGDYLGECVDSSINTEANVQEFENAIVEMSSNTSVDSKMTLCHVPPGNPSKAHTINVSSSSVESHLAHGDYEGECITTDSSDSDDDSKQSKTNGKENKNKANNKNKK